MRELLFYVTMEDCIKIRKQEDRRNGKIYIYSSVDTWDKVARKFTNQGRENKKT